MPRRLVRAVRLAAVRPGQGLRDAFASGYTARDLRADLQAGAVVGIVALPLSMALAIASGVPPQQGLYTAIVAGAVAALLGGSPVQVTGPTAAFVVVLAPIAARFGLGGLLLATLLAGVLLVGMGAARLGRLIEFVPYPVTTGFTAGIAVVIGVLQLKDFLGLDVTHLPEHFVERLVVLAQAVPSFDARDLLTGVATMLILVIWPRVTKRVPAPLVALAVVTAATWFGESLVPGFQVETIARRFTHAGPDGPLPGIPRTPPMPGWPWSFPGPDGAALPISWDLIRTLMGPAFAIAMLGAIESLLSATVADGMTGGKHDSDAELIGQGIGNIVAPFFGGIAATGAIARTATNVRYGARSPIAAVVHALFVLAAVLGLAPVLGHLPMASLAALLLVVAWNMGEFKHVLRVLRVAPRGDVIVLLTCFSLTVLFDMVVSVSVGVVLAALLFMERMAETATSDLVTEGHPHFETGLPRNLVIYEVAGPLFFGAAQKAMSTLRALRKNVKVVVLDLRAVPVMDATGLVNLESAIERLREAGIFVVLGGLQRQPAEVMERAGWRDDPGRLALCPSFPEALDRARRRLAEVEDGRVVNNGFVYRSRVERPDAGRVLLDHLSDRHRHSSRAEWDARIDGGAIAIDGERATPGAVLRAGQEIAWARPPWEEPEAPLSWALLYRDPDLLAVAKPAGLPTLAGGGFLEHTLLARVRRLHPEAAPVHRLDRGTSGVVLFARTAAAAAALADAFRARRIAKIYRALVMGHPARDAFEVNAAVARLPLEDDSAPFVAAATIAAPAAGRHRDAPRPAQTEVQVLERRADGTSLLEVRPITGRPHQIRIHLAAAGHPLIGEPFYVAGGSARPGAQWPGTGGFLLHALRIALAHPGDGRDLTIECVPPPVLRTETPPPAVRPPADGG